MRLVLIALLVAATPAFGQMLSRPTDAPVVDASSESWFRQREPIYLNGDAFHPAGATVFFNGNVMVRTGHYNGIPLYTDATLEPHSVLFVPAGRGLMQPYERPRRGVLAGSVGSRLSGFPVQLLRDAFDAIPAAAAAPTQIPLNGNAIAAYTPDPPPGRPYVPYLVAVPGEAGAPARTAVATAVATAAAGAAAREPAFRGPALILSPQPPASNDGVWFEFENQRWVHAGRAERHTDRFSQVGTYAGFPVYRRAGGDTALIYLPSRSGLLTPYRRKS